MIAIATPIKEELQSDQLIAGSAHDRENVGETERLLSLIGGTVLALCGLREGNLPGYGLAILGGSLIYRGLSGHCPAYGALGISTKKHTPAAAVAAGRGVKITQSVTIQRPASELYRHWCDLEYLPQLMSHLVSVQVAGKHSHWVALGPAGSTVSWQAEIINEEPDRLIAWRSLEGSQIATAGSVHFTALPGDRGTEVRVTLKYDPPAGTLGGWLAWLAGSDPKQQLREDLRRFKQLMEAGEQASVAGQSSGRY